MGKMWEGGRDLDGNDPVEYCDSRCLEAKDIGRGCALGGEVVEVISEGSERGSGLEVGGDEGFGGGEEAGLDVADMIRSTRHVVVLSRRPTDSGGLPTRPGGQT
jgi:hypothetical protein